jgi:hypothetical protein
MVGASLLVGITKLLEVLLPKPLIFLHCKNQGRCPQCRFVIRDAKLLAAHIKEQGKKKRNEFVCPLNTNASRWRRA